MLNDDVRVLEKSKVKEKNIVHPFEIGKALETKGITNFRDFWSERCCLCKKIMQKTS